MDTANANCDKANSDCSSSSPSAGSGGSDVVKLGLIDTLAMHHRRSYSIDFTLSHNQSIARPAEIKEKKYSRGAWKAGGSNVTRIVQSKVRFCRGLADVPRLHTYATNTSGDPCDYGKAWLPVAGPGINFQHAGISLGMAEQRVLCLSPSPPIWRQSTSRPEC